MLLPLPHISLCLIRVATLLIVGVFSFSGCVKEVLIRPDSIVNNADRDVLVVTKDGRKYVFAANDYSAKADSSRAYHIEGSGITYTGHGPKSEAFSGTINFSDIEKVVSSEATSFPYFVAVIAALSLAFMTWFVLMLNGRTLGG